MMPSFIIATDRLDDVSDAYGQQMSRYVVTYLSLHTLIFPG